MKILIALLLTAVTGAVHAQSWTDHVISGIWGPASLPAGSYKGGASPYGVHDALMPGMPTYWDWSQGSRGGRWNNVKPGEATAINGVVGHISRSLDYKVEVRNMEVWMLVNGKWERKFTTAGRDASAIFGSYYRSKDFSHAGGMTEEKGPAGGMMFKTREYHWSHFYCTGSNARPVIPSGFQRLHVRAQYRLVGNAASTALVIGRAGADYFLKVDADAPASQVQPSVFIARHRFIGPQWNWFTSTSMTADEIRKNPPPEPSDW